VKLKLVGAGTVTRDSKNESVTQYGLISDAVVLNRLLV
jgi:hypothetical protein